MRTLLQFVFLSLTLAGVYGFAGNAERWCPFGGVEGLYTYISEGNLTNGTAVPRCSSPSRYGLSKALRSFQRGSCIRG